MQLNIKSFILFGLFMIFIISCQEQNTNPESKVTSPSTKTIETGAETLFQSEAEAAKQRKSLVFKPILDSLTPKDSAFIPELVSTYQLEPWSDAEVVAWEQNALYGYPDSIWFLNIKLPNDSLCLPFGKHYQLIFDLKGHLLYEDSASQASLLKIWADQAPLLMTLVQDCKHQGQHHFFKYEKGMMIDIFNVLMESTPATFDQDAESDGFIYKPHQLAIKLEDHNKDGWNDLVFKGQKLILKGPDDKKYNEWYPYKREKLEYVFLFQKNEDWFVQEQ
jgi:hypothetical protein